MAGCPLLNQQGHAVLHSRRAGLRRASVGLRAPSIVRCAKPGPTADPVQAEQQHTPAQPVASTSGSQRQAEQERELQFISTTLPRTEQRYEALAAWVGAAVAFGCGIWYVQGAEKAQEYFAGYLLEQSLSVDNLFVFVLVFGFLKTPPEAQSKVLTWGIATAAVLRAVLIVLGVELVREFEPLLLFFAAILLFSSFKLLTASGGDDDDDLSDNPIYKFCARFIKVTDTYDGTNFFTTVNGARVATPLLLTLAVVELSDVVFAVDSIPAVFGVTLDPFIVYTSNVFAILSLRALYTFVATAMGELRFLDKAVAVVLGFIGSKMVLSFADVVIPTDVSLLVVGLVLGAGVGASLALPESKDD
ncbi:hypothetical protein HXX76_005635 [Chlamydomonas incerta]|uniref:Uncharacterized protein n=1 Tax=Chlamydomonas incerta TaxID=51695 RepID=A0A835TGU4_CHLIN|nr:hypothetical protein HXX76_005635 [Chlamydomonas incerta]|eukprot:KAG2438021.1 hypothetical protein HXX76_005635 [Chlamydomonas incerta]